MSYVEYAEVLRLRLHSLNALMERLEMVSLSSCAEVLTAQERIPALGKSIASHQRNIETRMNKLATDIAPELRSSVRNLTRLAALHEALSEEKHAFLRSMVERKHLKEDCKIQKTIRAATASLAANRLDEFAGSAPQIESFLTKLSEATREAHASLAGVEREVLAEKTVESLAQLGYQVRTKSRKNGMLLRGMKDDLSVAAEITAEGNLRIDLAGFEGKLCGKELKRINAELASRGVTIAVRDAVYHGKKNGGVLIEDAQKEFPFDFNPLESQPNKRERENRRRRLLQLHVSSRKNVQRCTNG